MTAAAIERIMVTLDNESFLVEKGFDKNRNNVLMLYRSGINFLSTSHEGKREIYSTLNAMVVPNNPFKSYYECQFITEGILDSICENIEYIDQHKIDYCITYTNEHSGYDSLLFLPILRLYAIKVFIEGNMEEYDTVLSYYYKALDSVLLIVSTVDDISVAIAENQYMELVEKREIQLLAYERKNIFNYYFEFRMKRKRVEVLYKEKANQLRRQCCF